MLILVTAALLALVAANVLLWPRVRASAATPAESVSILIPARDEEESLPACLRAVLAQVGVAEVLVYDDHSSDATAAVVEDFRARDPRVRLLPPSDLPTGWCGKTFALETLARHARSPWLLFLDADAMLAPRALPGMLGAARAYGVTFLSCWPGLDMKGFWEKLLMPVLNFVVLTLYPAPLALRRRRDASLGLAHGAAILVRRDAYERVGGHGAVRAELFEDTALAREWRRRGEQSLCLDGQAVVRKRMYENRGEIWKGFHKNFYPAFRRKSSFWTFLLLHAFGFLGPFVTLNLPAAGCVVAMRLLLALRFRHPLWSVLLHPAAEVFLVALGLSSWWRYRHGSGVEWKGRRYRQA